MNDIIVTKHSIKRCKERLGCSKKKAEKIANKALEFGIKYEDISHGSLKRYIGWLYESHNRTANNIIIYNRVIYIFKDKTLLTMFHLPKEFTAYADNLQKKLNDEE